MFKKSLRTVLAVPLTALTVVTMTACSSAGESEESANWREATTLEAVSYTHLTLPTNREV